MTQNWPGVVDEVGATQKDSSVHATAESPMPLKMVTLADAHCAGIAVGFVVVNAWPVESTATHSDAEEHESPVTVAPVASIGTGVLHELLAGSVEAIIDAAPPSFDRAAQKAPVGQETPCSGLGCELSVQSVATLVAGVEVAYTTPRGTLTASPTATHTVAVAHDIPVMGPGAGVSVIDDHVAVGPSLGSVVCRTCPSLVRATHKVVVGQEIPAKLVDPATPDSGFHADAPPVGLVDVITLPASSTATHSLRDGHEIPLKPCESTPAMSRQPCAGSVEVMTSPDESIATHNAEDGHETPSTPDGGDGSGSTAPAKLPHASGDGMSARAADPEDALRPTTTITISAETRLPATMVNSEHRLQNVGSTATPC